MRLFNKLKTIFFTVLILVQLIAPLGFVLAQADGSGFENPPGFTEENLIDSTIKNNITNTATKGGLLQWKFEEVVWAVINAVVSLLGLIFLVLIIYGGFKYMLSEGDATKKGDALKIIKYATIGLMIVVFSVLIMRYVFGALGLTYMIQLK